MIIDAVISILPLVLAAAVNMVFVRSSLLSSLARPIDGGRCWRDGRPLLGANKTWRGALGMIVLAMIFQVLCGILYTTSPWLTSHDLAHISHANTVTNNLWIGALLGAAYMVGELPNSFAKRRLNIDPGASSDWRQFLADHFDSVIMVALAALLFVPLSAEQFVALVLTGGLIHVAVTYILYRTGIKQEI